MKSTSDIHDESTLYANMNILSATFTARPLSRQAANIRSKHGSSPLVEDCGVVVLGVGVGIGDVLGGR